MVTVVKDVGKIKLRTWNRKWEPVGPHCFTSQPKGQIPQETASKGA